LRKLRIGFPLIFNGFSVVWYCHRDTVPPGVAIESCLQALTDDYICKRVTFITGEKEERELAKLIRRKTNTLATYLLT
jgi:hypothetical protein